MKTVILAAGMGTRLGDLTRTRPKCLIEIGGRTIIETQLELLEFVGIEDVTVVVGYRADDVRAVLKDRVRYVQNTQYEFSNSSYSLYLAKEALGRGWLHMNCDLLFSPRILEKILGPENSNAIVVDLDLKPTDDQEKVRLEDGRVTEMSKTMPYDRAHGKTIGMARFSAQGAAAVLGRLEDVVASGEKNRWFFSIIADVLAESRFVGSATDGAYWTEIDTPEDLQSARDRMEQVL